MQTIKLQNSDLVVLVDDGDYEKLNQYLWYLAPGQGNRARAYIRGVGRVEMAKYLTGYKPEVEHRDRNPLNNQRANLRPANRAQNQRNRNNFKNNTSGYKGVSFIRRKYPLKKPWRAQIRQDGILRGLGFFATAEEAAVRYDDEAVKIRGEYASTNFSR